MPVDHAKALQSGKHDCSKPEDKRSFLDPPLHTLILCEHSSKFSVVRRTGRDSPILRKRERAAVRDKVAMILSLSLQSWHFLWGNFWLDYQKQYCHWIHFPLRACSLRSKNERTASSRLRDLCSLRQLIFSTGKRDSRAVRANKRLSPSTT